MLGGLKRGIEFGDRQTPLPLARKVCDAIARSGFCPASILEPTCGTGSFLLAAVEAFASASHLLGCEVNPAHVEEARSLLAHVAETHRLVEIRQCDFFQTDWSSIIAALPEPILIIGNPPWVTNSRLGKLGSTNLPKKSNLDGLRGIDALTGESNFDISEWMLRELLQCLGQREALLAMLCKTSVARKVILSAWRTALPVSWAALYKVDARKHFAAAVDACLFAVRMRPHATNQECEVHETLDSTRPAGIFGLRGGCLVADIEKYSRWECLRGTGLRGWRSGIKHDCSKVLELRIVGGHMVNGLGERVDVEPEVLFPLVKSSDLAARRPPHRCLLVPHRSMAENPQTLVSRAPRAWRYLLEHADHLDARKSSVYKKRPRFSIFGVGPYSFAPWKIAISGLYKKLHFVKVGPSNDKPVVFDDTCYFFPCVSLAECQRLYSLLTSEPAAEFLWSLIFWDTKRPVTARILNMLDLGALARLLGEDGQLARSLAQRQVEDYPEHPQQLLLFAEDITPYDSTET